MLHPAVTALFTWPEAVGLGSVGLAAGALNAVAGGGSFLAFPALILTGMPSVQANATTTVAVWPGSLASAGAYRNAWSEDRSDLPLLATTSLLGGLLGGLLLLKTPDTVFDRLLPWLLLGATLIFIYGKKVNRRLHHAVPLTGRHTRRALAVLVQLLIATYGGFFGAGLGILILALLSLLGHEDIHAMNGLKTLLATLVNGTAVVTFICAGLIAWPQAVVMMIGAVIGGYSGARLAQRVAPEQIRRAVIVISLGMTLSFFLRAFLLG